MTAAGHRGRWLRWRPLPGNLIDRRGAALAPPVLLAVALNVAAVTGMVFTRRVAPLAGTGTLTLILPLTIWASGAPLATAITAIIAYRLLGWLSVPPALASLPVLRETTARPGDHA